MDQCCAEVEDCINEKDSSGNLLFECANSWNCLVTECVDPATYDECKVECDDGNFNMYYSDLVGCWESQCIDDCS